MPRRLIMLVIVGVAGLAVRGIAPDIQRYLKLRRM